MEKEMIRVLLSKSTVGALRTVTAREHAMRLEARKKVRQKSCSDLEKEIMVT